MFKEIKGLNMEELVNKSKAINIADMLPKHTEEKIVEGDTKDNKDFDFERE